MPKIIKDNGLTIVLMLMFAASLVGQWLSGWAVENENLQRHGGETLSRLAYLRDPAFISSVFENWESEFLQMAMYVVLTAFLFQRGSFESNDPDEPPREHGRLVHLRPGSPAPLRGGPATRWLYAHSLGAVLFALFLVSFVLHWVHSAKAAAAEALGHGKKALSVMQYLGEPQLWFESFQNWQSGVPVDRGAGRAVDLPAPEELAREQAGRVRQQPDGRLTARSADQCRQPRLEPRGFGRAYRGGSGETHA